VRQAAYDLLDQALALMARNQREDALSRCEAALAEALKAESPGVRATVARNAGLAYGHCQQPSEAVRCFEIAVANDPQDGRTYLTLAFLERQRANLNVAEGHLRRASQIAAETADDELRRFIENSGLREGEEGN
jgi:tetratricopeptide (TPR) repeat protein